MEATAEVPAATAIDFALLRLDNAPRALAGALALSAITSRLEAFQHVPQAPDATRSMRV